MKVAVLTDAQLLRSDDKNLPKTLSRYGFESDVVDWRTIDPGQPYGYDVSLIRSPWNYPDYSEDFLGVLQFVTTKSQLFHDINMVKWNMDKKYLCDFYKLGLPVVPTVLIRNLTVEKLQETLGSIKQKYVVKPRIGASGKYTFLMDKADELDMLKPLFGTDVLIQPFISSILENGEYSFIYFNETYSHAVKKVAKPGEFRVQDDHGGSVDIFVPTKEMLDTVDHLMQNLNLKTLYARIDMVETNGKLLLMELELIEPELFFRFGDQSEAKLIHALKGRIG